MLECLFARTNGGSSLGRLSNTGSTAKTQIIKLPSGRDSCMMRNKAKEYEGEGEREKRSGSQIEGRREKASGSTKGLPCKYLCSGSPRDGGSSNSNDKTIHTEIRLDPCPRVVDIEGRAERGERFTFYTYGLSPRQRTA